MTAPTMISSADAIQLVYLAQGISSPWTPEFHGGPVALVEALLPYAGFMAVEIDLAYNPDEGFPGIVEYEVTTFMGIWLREQLEATGKLPPMDDFREEAFRRLTAWVATDGQGDLT